jgi:hypothetical protein
LVGELPEGAGDLSIGGNHGGQYVTGTVLPGNLPAHRQAHTRGRKVAMQQAEAVSPAATFWDLACVGHRRAPHSVEMMCYQFKSLTVAVALCPESGGVGILECANANNDSEQRRDAADGCGDIGDVGPTGHGFEA